MLLAVGVSSIFTLHWQDRSRQDIKQALSGYLSAASRRAASPHLPRRRPIAQTSASANPSASARASATNGQTGSNRLEPGRSGTVRV